MGLGPGCWVSRADVAAEAEIIRKLRPDAGLLGSPAPPSPGQSSIKGLSPSPEQKSAANDNFVTKINCNIN